MADKMMRNYKISGSGVLVIEDGRMTLICEDKGEYDLSAVLEDLNDKPVKFSFSYDEDYTTPEVDEETGELI